MAHLNELEIEKVLNTLLDLLIEKGVLKPLDGKERLEIIENVRDKIQAGEGLSHEDLKEPDMVNKLFCALTIAAIAGPNADKTLDLIFDNSYVMTNPKLLLAAAYDLVMKQNPELKLDIKLLMEDKENLTLEQQEKLEQDLKLVFAAFNNKNLKLSKEEIAEIITIVKEELKNPGNTADRLKEQLDENNTKEMEHLSNLFGRLGLPSIMPNIIGAPDAFPTYGFSPLNELSGTFDDPRLQAATGENVIVAERNVSGERGNTAAEETLLGVAISQVVDALAEQNIKTYSTTPTFRPPGVIK